MANGIYVLDWEDFIGKAKRFNSGNKVCWIEGKQLKAILASSIRWGFRTTEKVEEKKKKLEQLGFEVAKKVSTSEF